MSDGKHQEARRRAGATCRWALLLGSVIGVAALVLCAAASGATASDRAASLQPRLVTPCLRGGHPGDITPGCAQAVARARAFMEHSGGGSLSIAPSAPARSIAASPLVEGGGNSLSVTQVEVGIPVAQSGEWNYDNGESFIRCGPLRSTPAKPMGHAAMLNSMMR